MRKNSVRKFIHAILDLLPLFVIPIFAIYSMNHEISDNSINTSGYEVRNKYETNEVNTYADLVVGNIYHIDTLVVSDNYSDTAFEIRIIHCDEIIYGNLDIDEIYLYDLDNNEILFDGYLNLYINIGTESFITTALEPDIYFHNLEFVVTSNLSNFKQMCQTEGNNDITSSDYQVLEYVWNDGIVLDDEDIMSQFVYVTYNAVDKYFNMGNVFNMNGVYDWFVVNIFGGNAPVSMFIVWNVVLYEFVMDLLMLLYGLFMWFIDMIERLMSKPLDSIK